MNSFVFEQFVCSDCDATNLETDVPFDESGEYDVVCASCGGTHRFGNVFEDRVSATHDAYNDMVRGK